MLWLALVVSSQGPLSEYVVRDGLFGVRSAFNRFKGARGVMSRAECAALLASPKTVGSSLLTAGSSDADEDLH